MKKTVALLLAVVLTLASLSATVSAAEARASDYLSGYGATLAQGNASGGIVVNYYVNSSKPGVTQIGVSKIEIYTSTGTRVKTIYGTTANGLIANTNMIHAGSYPIICEPDTEYYAKVTVMEKNSQGSDSRVITTNSIKSHA